MSSQSESAPEAALAAWFDRFNEVDWSEHEAGELPSLLAAITSDEEAQREKGREQLYELLLQEEAVSAATPLIVPHLIELLGVSGVLDRAHLLVLLGDLGDLPKELVQTTEFDEGEPWIVRLRQAHQNVVEGVDAYLALLEDKDEDVRTVVPYALAVAWQRADDISGILRQRLDAEPLDRARASILLCLGLLNPKGDVPLFETHLDKAQPAIVRLAASMALLKAVGRFAPVEVLELLLDLIKNPEMVRDDYIQLPWADADVLGDVSLLLASLREGEQNLSLPPLLATLDEVEGDKALNVVEAALHVAFGFAEDHEHHAHAPDEEPLERALSGDQRQVIRALAECHEPWQQQVAMRELLDAFDLPMEREDLRDLAEAQH